MTTLALDENNNFVDGETLPLLSGCNEVAQNVRVCLHLFPTESCVFPEAGIDWFSPQMRSEVFARTILTTKISAVEGVDAVNSLDISVSGNRFAKIDANLSASGEMIVFSTPDVVENMPPVPNTDTEIICQPDTMQNDPPVPNAQRTISCSGIMTQNLPPVANSARTISCGV